MMVLRLHNMSQLSNNVLFVYGYLGACIQPVVQLVHAVSHYLACLKYTRLLLAPTQWRNQLPVQQSGQ